MDSMNTVAVDHWLLQQQRAGQPTPREDGEDG